MEPRAWVLGIGSSVLSQTAPLDPADACAVAMDTNSVVPPDPLYPTGRQGPPGVSLLYDYFGGDIGGNHSS